MLLHSGPRHKSCFFFSRDPNPWMLITPVTLWLGHTSNMPKQSICSTSSSSYFMSLQAAHFCCIITQKQDTMSRWLTCPHSQPLENKVGWLDHLFSHTTILCEKVKYWPVVIFQVFQLLLEVTVFMIVGFNSRKRQHQQWT